MRVLVTGREGQLARSLADRSRGWPQIELLFAARPGCDLALPGSAAAAIARLAPDLVVNAAAFTAVDVAESETALALRVNGEAPGEVAQAAAAVGAPMIHISTDYVFTGDWSGPIPEDAPLAPCNIYGATKLAGEERVRSAQPDHLILRTAWVYSPFARNFVRTMLRLASEGGEIAVVADQRGCPTSALDLADLILALADRRRTGDQLGWGDTYHAAGAAEASWAELAEAIMRISAAAGGPSARIRPTASADRPTPAPRPADSRLDCSRLRSTFGQTLPGWPHALPPVVHRLLDQPL